jgi:chemotaxis protein histidine kinase CheA
MRKLGEMEDRLERQSKQARELKNLQSDLAREQKAREEKESELKKKEQAFAVTEKEHNELKQTLAEIEKKYAAGQAQIKAIAQARSDLERERELLKQAGKRAGETTSREKALARQNRGLKDQLQTVGKKNAALAEEQERQSQSIAELAAENKPERSAPESVVEAEKKIIAQAKGETAPESGQPPQDAEKAKPPVFRSARAEADWHYQTGIRKWDAGDVDGAIAEFRKTVGIDGSLAGAYYNIALGYARKDDRDRACDYAYKAGEVYLENKNFKQATRMVVLIKNIDPSSSLIEKLRKQIAKKQ